MDFFRFFPKLPPLYSMFSIIYSIVKIIHILRYIHVVLLIDTIVSQTRGKSQGDVLAREWRLLWMFTWIQRKGTDFGDPWRTGQTWSIRWQIRYQIALRKEGRKEGNTICWRFGSSSDWIGLNRFVDVEKQWKWNIIIKSSKMCTFHTLLVCEKRKEERKKMKKNMIIIIIQFSYNLVMLIDFVTKPFYILYTLVFVVETLMVMTWDSNKYHTG